MTPPSRGFALLSSPLAQALRGEVGTLVAWLAGVGLFAFVVGVISDSFASGLSSKMQHDLAKLGGASLLTPTGALSFYFVFFVLVISLFMSAQIDGGTTRGGRAAARDAVREPGQPSSLAGRAVSLLAAGGAHRARADGRRCSPGQGPRRRVRTSRCPACSRQGANCLPAAFLFLALAALAFAAIPRATTIVAYGVVVVAFIWNLLGELLGAPDWTLGLSPFQHVGLVPIHVVQAAGGGAMLGHRRCAVVASVAAFERRDLAGA